MPGIKAITFDLWDTVFIDDSDEAKRKSMGLAPKPVARRELVTSFLSRHGRVSRELVDAAYDTTDAAFNKVWHGLSVTWTVEERLRVLLTGLGRSLPRDELAELVRLHEEMELEVSPDAAPGIHQALKALHGKYRLGVISDAIFSPGRVLRGLLEKEGLADLFDVFVFSDEIGGAKPDASVFRAAANGLGVEPSEIVHVGDREPNDIAGARAAGARAILTTVVKDRGSAQTEADAICDDYSNLVDSISLLEND